MNMFLSKIARMMAGEPQPAVVRAFQDILLGVRRRGNVWEVYAGLGTIQYLVGSIDTENGVYRHERQDAVFHNDFTASMQQYARERAERLGLRIVY